MRQVVGLAYAQDNAFEQPIEQPRHKDDAKDLYPGDQNFYPILHPGGQVHLKTMHNQEIKKPGENPSVYCGVR